MGTAFVDIPGVGARSTWPDIGTEAAHKIHTKIQAFRWAEVKFAIDRDEVYYIEQDSAGDSFGGTGNGSFANPYKCYNVADLSSLISALQGGDDVGIILMDDSVFAPEVSNTDQSIQILEPHVSIGRSFTGSRRPEITGFAPLAGSGPASNSSPIGSSVSPLGGGIYEVDPDAPGIVIYWMRGRLAASTDRDDFQLQPYRIAADATDVGSNTYSFFDDGTTKTVNVGDHDIYSIEAALTTGPGIRIADVDDVAVDDVIVEGFGMTAMFASGSGQCLRSEATGTNVHVFRRCRGLWGDYHTNGHFVSVGGGSGGIVTWHQCQFGYHTWDANGGGDGCVNYNGDGSQEGARYSCTQVCGGLNGTAAVFTAFDTAYQAGHGGAHSPSYGNISIDSPTGIFPGTPYAHCTAGGAYPSYLAELDCTYAVLYGQRIMADHICGSNPTVTDKDDQQSYRVYTNNREVETYQLSPDALIGVHDRTRWTISQSPPPSSFGYMFSTGGLKGIFLNTEFELHAIAGTWTGKSLRMFVAGTSDFRWLHPRLRLTGANCNGLRTLFSTGLNTCSIYNGVVSIENGVTAANFEFTTSGGSFHFTEATPGSGGILGLAQWGVQSTQVDGLTGVTALAAAATWTARADVPVALVNAAQEIPTGLDVWQDSLGQRRNRAHAKRTIGPIEAKPNFGSISRIDRTGRALSISRVE